MVLHFAKSQFPAKEPSPEWQSCDLSLDVRVGLGGRPVKWTQAKVLLTL